MVSRNFVIIDWANEPYFIKTEIDPTGGIDYPIAGISKLLSVPYTLHSKTVECITGIIAETDLLYASWDKSNGIMKVKFQIYNHI